MRRFASACWWKSAPQLEQHVDFIPAVWDCIVAAGDIRFFVLYGTREKGRQRGEEERGVNSRS